MIIDHAQVFPLVQGEFDLHAFFLSEFEFKVLILSDCFPASLFLSRFIEAVHVLILEDGGDSARKFGSHHVECFKSEWYYIGIRGGDLELNYIVS
jgi:hypothetical protein